MNPAQQNLSSLIVSDDVFQTKLNQFAKELRDLGLDKLHAEKVLTGLGKTAANQVTAKISMLMNDSEWEKWKEFVNTGANAAQQIIILNKFLKDRTGGKDLDIITTEITEELMRDTLDQITKKKELSIKIAKLGDSQVDAAMEALDNDDFETVEDILNSGTTN